MFQLNLPTIGLLFTGFKIQDSAVAYDILFILADT